MSDSAWWTTSWNPTHGCTPASEGCANCWARRSALRLRGRYGYPARRPFAVRVRRDRLDQPLGWRKARRVFVSDMGDLFHEDVPDAFLDEVFATMALADRHTFYLLSKRPLRMAEYFNSARAPRLCDSPHARVARCAEAIARRRGEDVSSPYWDAFLEAWPLPKVWLGVTAESHEWALTRIPLLLDTPAAKRFVSLEPLLSRIDPQPWLPPDPETVCWRRCHQSSRPYCKGPCETWSAANHRHLTEPHPDWVVVGCERLSANRVGRLGTDHPEVWWDWVREIRDAAVASGVPFFLKQGPGPDGRVVDLPKLDGRRWNEVPV